MVDAGVVDEIQENFVPGANYSRGVRRAIRVPELGEYFLVEKEISDKAEKEKMLQHAIARTKENTCKLVEMQLLKIHRINYELGWGMTKIDSTVVFEAILKGVDYKNLYHEIIFKPSMEIVKRFLQETTRMWGKTPCQYDEQVTIYT